MTRVASKVRARPGAAWLLGAALACVCAVSPQVAAAPKTGVVAGSGSSAGGVFTAGAQGAEYLLPSQARLKLEPHAAVRLFPVPQQLQLAPGAKTNTYSFALLRGRVDVTVPARPKSAVLCSVGKLSALVGAGQATVLSQPDKTVVAAVDGDVRTLLDDRWTTIAPGMVARYVDGERATPEPVPAPPRLLPGQRLWFSPGDPVSVSGFALAAVPGAAGYELALRKADGSEEQLRTVRGQTTLSEAFDPIPPGDYQLTARSLDGDGIAGSWATAERVRVVGVMLPPGAYASGGDIFVGKGQEVSFSHTDGLEMTYEGAGRYIPASQAVSLYRGETTVVSFRVPGSVFPTSARLRPRSLYAHVEIGPSRAVWPKDPVHIAVELRSKSRDEAPEWVELKPEVTVGIEPVEVSFTRQGQRLVGTVPALDRPGPWVLRVEVKDQFGALLGRDFLEIAKAPATPPADKAPARVARK